MPGGGSSFVVCREEVPLAVAVISWMETSSAMSGEGGSSLVICGEEALLAVAVISWIEASASAIYGALAPWAIISGRRLFWLCNDVRVSIFRPFDLRSARERGILRVIVHTVGILLKLNQLCLTLPPRLELKMGEKSWKQTL